MLDVCESLKRRRKKTCSQGFIGGLLNPPVFDLAELNRVIPRSYAVRKRLWEPRTSEWSRNNSNFFATVNFS